MHEMSIAQSIVELAEQQARDHHAAGIKEVELEIGKLSGVELQSLFFALESAVKGTLLEKAEIVRHIIDGEGRCTDCETRFSMETLLTPCPRCGSYFVHVIKGKELRIKSIVIK